MARYLASRILLSAQTITADDKATMPEYSDMVIVFVCLLCALVCVVGVLGVVRWTCLKRPFPSISTTTTTTSIDKNSTPSEFFKKKIVESLPRLTYKSSQSTTTSDDNNAPPVPVPVSESGESECVICLSEFIDGDEIRVLPRCKHVFHVACIDTWLIGSHTFGCPSCRQTLVVKQCQKCKVDGSINSVSLPTQPEADYLP